MFSLKTSSGIMRKGINELISIVFVVVFVLGISGVYYHWQNSYVINTTQSQKNQTTKVLKQCSKISVKTTPYYQTYTNETYFEEDLDYKDLDYNGVDENKTSYIYIMENTTVDSGYMNITYS